MTDDDRTDRSSDESADGAAAGGEATNGEGLDDGAIDTGTVGDGHADVERGGDADAESMPLEDLARELGERRQQASDDDLDEAFEPVDVGEVDTDELWEEVFDDDPADEVGSVGPVGDVGEQSGPIGSADGVASQAANGSTVDADDWTTADETVPKREYCQRCPHFSEPPEATCSHEGTEIVEVVSVDQFRVRNCPMVDDE